MCLCVTVREKVTADSQTRFYHQDLVIILAKGRAVEKRPFFVSSHQFTFFIFMQIRQKAFSFDFIQIFRVLFLLFDGYKTSASK